MPKSVRHWLVVSGKQYQPEAIKELAGAANMITINFDVSAFQLPAQEMNRKLKNVAVFFVSPTPFDANAQFRATQPVTNVNITFKQGIAMSNLPPTGDDLVPPPLPLNALAEFAADQRFTLTIDKNQNPGVDFGGVSDVVFAIEYAADLR
jgi:hypothetical protein